jgi:hypothetical protein
MCCSVVQFTAAASGTASATSVPVSEAPALASWPNIQPMPSVAMAMDTQVRNGSS